MKKQTLKAEQITGGYCTGCLKPLDKCQCLEEELADKLEQALSKVKILNPKKNE